MRVFILSFSLFGIATSFSTLSCSGGNTGAASDGGADVPPPPTHFRADVLPLFVRSCDFSGCHITKGGMLQYLGEKNVDPSTFADMVYMGIVNVKTIEDPSMNFVTPGDPANSFLLHKMAFDLSGLMCDPNNALFTQYQSQYMLTGACGAGMPITMSTPLMDMDVNTVRFWIEEGAKND